MSSLEVLKYHEVMMTVMGIYPRSPRLSFRFSWLQPISPYFIIFWLIICNILSTMYVYHGSSRLTEVFEALAIVFGGSDALAAYLNMKWKMEKAAVVQSELQEIVDRGNCWRN